MQSSISLAIRKLVATFFCLIVPSAALLLVVVFTVSPRAVTFFVLWADKPVRAGATLHA